VASGKPLRFSVRTPVQRLVLQKGES